MILLWLLFGYVQCECKIFVWTKNGQHTYTHAHTHTRYDIHTITHSHTRGTNTTTHIHAHIMTYTRDVSSHRWEIADILQPFTYPPHHRETDNRRAELVVIGRL